ncbi:MAG TPA: aldo/keto reductase [Actinomycetes bacterium]|jgi:aryl-alcohol dehydrogenase-like predicted oxidoreductase|nr:aldo/keto reductase [Actinomycetes bacterium]
MTERIRLGRSDLKVPRLGVGAMTWGSPSGRSRWGPAKLAYGGTPGPEEERRAFEASLAAGADLFDTAAMYSGGASERRLGELAQGRSVVIATKFPPGWLSKAEVFPEALDQSLARLRRSTIDLYQHHFPSRRVSIPVLMGLMADAVQAGKVRAIGVSNYSAAQLRTAHAALAERGVPLASNQVEYSLLHRAPEVNGVLDACRELGIMLIAYQPLAMGVLTGKYRPGDKPRGIRRYGRYYRGDGLQKVQPVVTLLREIGERHSKAPAQVALRWLIQQENVLPIPGAKNRRQAASNAEALSFSLVDAEVETLDQATTAWRK